MPPIRLVKGTASRTVDDGSPEFSKLVYDGWAPEDSGDAAARTHHAGRVESQAGAANAVSSYLSNAFGTASFGLTRGLQALTTDDLGREELLLRDEAHPTAATAGRVTGVVGQGLLLPGSAAGRGVLGLAKNVGVGAAIGGGDVLGQNLANIAIDDNVDLTTEAALAGVPEGIALGGAAAGIFGVGERTLAARKRLFPGTAPRPAAPAAAADALPAARLPSRGFADEPIDLGIDIPRTEITGVPDEVLPPAHFNQRGVRDDGVDIRHLLDDGEVTKEVAERTMRDADAEVGSLLDDTDRLDAAATARLDAGVLPHLTDPAKAAHLEARAAREAQLATDRSTWDAARLEREAGRDRLRAAGDEARADLAARAAGEVPAYGRPERFGPERPPVEPGAAAPAVKPRKGKAAAPEVAPAGDLEQQLRASVEAGPGGVEAARAAQRDALAAKKRAAAELDPELARLQVARDNLRAARDMVADLEQRFGPEYAASVDDIQRGMRRGEVDRTIAKWRRPAEERDAARGFAEDYTRTPHFGDKRTPWNTTNLRTAKQTRILDEDLAAESIGYGTGRTLTDDELVAQSLAFRDRVADPEDIARFGERPIRSQDLPEYLLKRGRRLEDVEVMPGAHGLRALTPEELPMGKTQGWIDDATGETFDTYTAAAQRVRPATHDEVLLTARRGDAGDDIIERALTNQFATAGMGRLAHVPEAEAMQAIAKLEQAEHDLVEILGPATVPPGSARRAEGLAAAMADHAEQRAMASMRGAAAMDDVARVPMTAEPLLSPAAPPPVDAAGFTPRRSRQGAAPRPGEVTMPGAAEAGRSGALDALAALEVLATAGIPGIPSAAQLPGPLGTVASLYLKARAGWRVFQKLGGKVPRTAETAVVARAGAARDRLRSIVERSLAAGEAGARTARRVAPGVAAVLAVPLFRDDDGLEQPPRKRKGEDNVTALWEARTRELDASAAPGAVARAVRQRLPTTNPRLAAAAEATVDRGLSYLRLRIPRPPPSFGLGTAREWRPGDADLAQFARIVQAVTKPLDTLEAGIDGNITMAQVEAIRDVYPTLYAEAQRTLVELSIERDDIPYSKRNHLSTLWGVPMDATQLPAFGAAMQAGYAKKPAGQPAPAPGAPPTPSIASPVDVSRATMLPEQMPR